MAVELVGKPLLTGAREKYNLVLVREPWFLNNRQYSTTALVCVRRQGEETGTGAGVAASLVDSPTGRFDPVVVTAFSEASDDVNVAMPFLEAAARSFDPLEPFQRIERALEKVHEEQTLDGRQ
jgi:hypothetical protein